MATAPHLIDIPQRCKDGIVLGPPLAAVQAAGAAVAGLGVDLHAVAATQREFAAVGA